MPSQNLGSDSTLDISTTQGVPLDSSAASDNDESANVADLKAAVQICLDDLEHGRFTTINDASQLTKHIHRLTCGSANRSLSNPA